MAAEMDRRVGRGELDDRATGIGQAPRICPACQPDPTVPAPVGVVTVPGLRAGYAKYVGRVGALAVALGIGTAIATGHGLGAGVAHADDSPSVTTNTSTPGTETGAGVADTASSTSTDPGTGPAGPRSPRLPPTRVPDMILNATGGAHPPRDDPEPPRLPRLRTPLADPATADTDDAPDAASTTPSTVRATSSRNAKSPADRSVSAAAALPATMADRSSLSAPTLSAPTNRDERLLEPLAVVLSAKDPAVTIEQKAPVRQQTVADAPAPRDALAALPGQRITVAAGLVAAAVAPLFAPGPLAPQGPPTLLGILAWARREIQRTFFNQSPTASPMQTSQSATGVVTGTLGAADPDGDPLFYRVSQAPANGTVMVNPDGTYSYTPSAVLAASGGADAFTVTITEANVASHLHGIPGLIATALRVFSFGLIDLPDGTSIQTVIPVTVRPEAAVIQTIGGVGQNGVPVFDQPVDVDVSTGGDRGVIVNAGDGSVTIIEANDDGPGWVVGGNVAYGGGAGRVALDVATAYVTSQKEGGGSTLSLVDLADARLTSQIDLEGEVTDVGIDRTALSGRAERVYAARSDGTLVAIDPRRGAVVGSVQTRDPAVARTARLAVSPGAREVYVASGGRL